MPGVYKGYHDFTTDAETFTYLFPPSPYDVCQISAVLKAGSVAAGDKFKVEWLDYITTVADGLHEEDPALLVSDLLGGVVFPCSTFGKWKGVKLTFTKGSVTSLHTKVKIFQLGREDVESDLPYRDLALRNIGALTNTADLVGD